MRIWLSKPHMGGTEEHHVSEAFKSNFIAPIGPQLNGFERALEAHIGGGVHCACVSSGTAALHLALHMENLGPSDEVWLSSMTFAGGVFPVNYVGAKPVFFDLDPASWTLSADLIEESLKTSAKLNKLPKAIIATDLYGQASDYDRLESLSEQYGVSLFVDAAESMGTTYKGRTAGYAGKVSIISFNGNKMMTTGGGGVFVSRDKSLADKARFLSTQARDPAPHYEHSEYGFNYRLGNVPAAIGLGQLECLDEHVKTRQAIAAKYMDKLAGLDNIEFMPEASWGGHSRWLTTAVINKQDDSFDVADFCQSMTDIGIETRRLWKPMHMQPLYSEAEYCGTGVDEHLFKHGVCLPSSSNMTDEEHNEVIETLLTKLS